MKHSVNSSGPFHLSSGFFTVSAEFSLIAAVPFIRLGWSRDNCCTSAPETIAACPFKISLFNFKQRCQLSCPLQLLFTHSASPQPFDNEPKLACNLEESFNQKPCCQRSLKKIVHYSLSCRFLPKISMYSPLVWRIYMF